MFGLLGNTGVALRRLHRQLYEGPFAPGTIGQTRPNSDPLLQGASSNLSFYQFSRLVVGMITDSTAIANCYRVQFEKLRSPLPCYLATQTSLSAFGARQLTTLQPGTMVIVMLHEQLTMGAILAVIPPMGTPAYQIVPDQISQAGRSRTDKAHRWPLMLPDNGLISNTLAGRPFDATTVGESGWITETGLRILIDPFMVQVAVDEFCGVFAFYHDQLLRLAGHNIQFWAAGYEREGLDDGGEYNDYEGWTPYPWENQGLMAPGDARRELSPTAWQVATPHYAAWEPIHDRIQPWHRQQEFHGYLGQGGKSLVVTSPTESGINTYSGGPGASLRLTGLFDSNVGLDGRYFVQSAKGISFVKRLGICPPKKLRRPEQSQPSGDGPQNYKSSGIAGNGPEHKITGGPAAESETPELQRAAGVMDLHAYLFNYSGVHPFFWHANDWAVPEESALTHTGGRSAVMPQFGSLGSSMYLKAPQPLQVRVDHRYGQQAYYQNECGFTLMEDGGILFYDGFGSEILMSAGSIKLAAPGDIWLKSGRNLVQWAGADWIARAKNSADLTCTTKDVRIKSERNLQLLAGNSGTGGVLIESRAKSKSYQFEGKVGEDVESSGILLRASRSDVVAWSAGIYLRTGGGDVQPGAIVLDANKGKQPIVTHSDTLQHYVKNQVVHWFGTDGKIKAANAFSAKSCLLGGQLAVNGSLTATGTILSKGNIIAVGGHIVTERAKSTNYMVAPLEGEGLSKAQSAVSQVESTAKATLPESGGTFYTTLLEGQFYASSKPGNDTVIENAQVSLRTASQYRTEDFLLYEDRWQQLNRLSGSQLPQWEEKPVVCRADPETFPYPGKAALTGDTFLQQDPTLVDVPAGRSRNRGQSAAALAAAYETPKYGEPRRVILNGNYPTVR